MMCEGKYPEYIIGTITGLNDKAHAVVSGDWRGDCANRIEGY